MYDIEHGTMCMVISVILFLRKKRWKNPLIDFKLSIFSMNISCISFLAVMWTKVSNIFNLPALMLFDVVK